MNQPINQCCLNSTGTSRLSSNITGLDDDVWEVFSEQPGSVKC